MALLAAALLASGCATSRPPALSPELRARIGTVAVVLKNRTVEFEAVVDSNTGKDARIWEGFSQTGSNLIALPVYLFLIIPILLFNAHQPDKATLRRMQDCQKGLEDVFRRLQLSDRMRDTMENKIETLTNLRVASVWLDEDGKSRTAAFDRLSKRGIDAVIEVDLRQVLCTGKLEEKVTSTLVVSTRVLLVDKQQSVYSSVLTYEDPQGSQLSKKWNEIDDAAFATQLRRSLDEIATALVGAIFLRYEPTTRDGP